MGNETSRTSESAEETEEVDQENDVVEVDSSEHADRVGGRGHNSSKRLETSLSESAEKTEEIVEENDVVEVDSSEHANRGEGGGGHKSRKRSAAVGSARLKKKAKKSKVEEENDVFEVDSFGNPLADNEESSCHKSSKRPQASGSARKVNKTKVQSGDGLEFVLPITQTLEARNEMTVPRHFANAFDTSEKKYVFLSTEKGDFCLDVKNYHRSDRGPKGNASLIVVFNNGWKKVYRENHLSVGMKCLFELKENTVNGDDSGFSMKVSVLER